MDDQPFAVMDNADIYTAIVENNDTAVASKDLRGIILSWNLGAEKLLGYSAREIVGKKIAVLIPDELEDEEAAILAQIARGEDIKNLITRRRHKNGNLVDVSLTVSPVRNKAGVIVGAVKIIRDLSALRRAEQRFEMVVESAPNAIVMADLTGSISLVNRQAESLFGYSRNEMLGQSVDMLVPEEHRPGHARDRANFARSPAIRSMGAGRDLFAKHRSGSLFPVEVGLNPIKTDDGTMFLASIVDITERRRMEEQTRNFNRVLERKVAERTAELDAANRELKEFAYIASHDLKAPLRVIDNASRWLEEDLEAHLTDDIRDTIRLMRSRVQRMEQFLDDLLDYSRIGRVTDETYLEVLTGDELVSSVQLLQPLPPGFHLTVSPSFTDIRVHRSPLQQVLLNLLGNAIKHHDREEGWIDISVHHNEDCYSFYIKDDGPGIPDEFHEQIFEMFQTLRPRDQVEGSGMGLAIARKIVRRAGGELTVQSGPGRGTTFAFTWPMIVVQKGNDNEY